MVKKELAPGIVVYKDVYENPSGIIESIESAVESKVISWNLSYINNGEVNYNDISVRDVDVFGVHFPKSNLESFEKNISTSHSEEEVFEFFMGDTLKNIFQPCLNDYKMFYNTENFNNYDMFQVLKYKKNQHFNNHIDDSIMFHRRISISYYLNSDFEGGEIEFPRFNLKYKPEKNDLLVFPSTYVYNHIVHPILDGTRYTVVTWIN